LLFIVTFAKTLTSGSSELLPIECELGSSYWCANVTNAVECDAVEHCSAVWTSLLNDISYHRTTSMLESPYCKLCKGISNSFRNFGTSKQVQDHVTRYSVFLCNDWLKEDEDEVESKSCDIVESCLPDLMSTLLEQFGKYFSNFCQDFHICEKTLVETPFSYYQPKPSPWKHFQDDISAEDNEECEESLSDFLESMTEPTFQYHFKETMRINTCTKFFSKFEGKTCLKLIETSMKVYNDYISMLKPKEVCKALHKCSGDSSKIVKLINKANENLNLVKLGSEIISNLGYNPLYQ